MWQQTIVDSKDIIIGLISLVVFYAIVQTTLAGPIKALLSIVVLTITGEYYKTKYNFETMYVFLLVRTKNGLSLINKLAKQHADVLCIFADIAAAVAFGALSLFLVDWTPVKNRIIAFMAALGIIFTIGSIYPYAISYIVSFGDFPKSAVSGSVSVEDVLLPAITIIGGLFSAVVFTSIATGLNTIVQILQKISGTNVIVQQGATLLLPGINIPLVEGIIALGVILIVHELAHGLLSIVGRVPLKSTGLVFFGSLPVGAFVEPDEKRLFNSQKKVQARVVIAGVGANFIAAIVSGLLFLGFVLVTAPYTVEGCYVVKGTEQLPEGTLITAINGHLGCSVPIAASSRITVETFNKGTIGMVATDQGKLGINYYLVGPYSSIRFYSNPILHLLYHVLGLTFAINLFVGLINLLPIPFFDGDHVLKSFAGDGILYKAIRFIVFVAFLVLLLPAIL